MFLSRRPAVAPLAILVALLCACSSSGSGDSTPPPTSASGGGTIEVSTPAFDDGGTIPTQFTCDGAGVSPPLAWSGVPAGAQTVAIVVDDPDAPSGTFTHWVLAGLQVADGVVGEDVGTPAGTVSALNSAGKPGWTPPCPPSGTHHYRFTVYALAGGGAVRCRSGDRGALQAIAAAALAHGTLTGTYCACRVTSSGAGGWGHAEEEVVRTPSPLGRVVVAVAGALQVGLLVAAQVDIARRPAGAIRGPKLAVATDQHDQLHRAAGVLRPRQAMTAGRSAASAQ